jgi:hypothetical protein
VVEHSAARCMVLFDTPINYQTNVLHAMRSEVPGRGSPWSWRLKLTGSQPPQILFESTIDCKCVYLSRTAVLWEKTTKPADMQNLSDPMNSNQKEARGQARSFLRALLRWSGEGLPRWCAGLGPLLQTCDAGVLRQSDLLGE